jgi:membrane fusion protein (multidrug efflux system)
VSGGWHRRSSILAALAIVALPVLAGCDEGGQRAEVPPPPPAVVTAKVALRSVSPSAEFVGRVRAIEKVEIKARVQGFLESREFEEGEIVERGQLLFRIERAPYEAALAQEKANLAGAQAAAANTALQLARAEELARNQNIPKATLDQRRAEDLQARAEVERYEAAVRQAEINLSYTRIEAPISGRIGQAAVTQGNIVGPDSGVLATIVSVDPIYVTFPVSQRLILQSRAEGPIRPEQFVVRLRLPDNSVYRHPGRIDFIDNQVDRGTDTILVRAVFPNPDGVLVDGTFVRVFVERKEAAEALVIPHAAVQIDQAGSYVLVVTADDTVEQRRITTGAQQGADIVVERGLREGERIIVEGQQKVRPGQVVAPTPAQAEPAEQAPGQAERAPAQLPPTRQSPDGKTSDKP